MQNLNLLDFKNTQLIPFLLSERGMGKTQFVKDYCNDKKLDFFTLNVAAIEASDFCGLPYIKDNTTYYAKPIFLNLKNGILFLDELNRVTDIDVKAALNSLLLDRSINGHTLDDSVLIVGAGNPVNEDYETTDFDVSLKDRIIEIPFYHDYSDFLKYLESSGDTPFLKFVQNSETIFENVSRRRIFETNKMVVATKKDNYILDFLGQNIFNLYNAFNSKRLFNLDNVLQGDTTKDVVGIQSVSKDVVKYLLSDFKKDTAKNINKFLTNIPAECKLIFFKELKESEISESQVNKFLETGVFKNLGKYLKELF